MIIRLIILAAILCLSSCQDEPISFDTQRVGLVEVQLNSVIGVSRPFEGVDPKTLTMRDLVFLSLYIDDFLAFQDSTLNRQQVEVSFRSISQFKDHAVYRQFPTHSSTDSRVLLPYYRRFSNQNTTITQFIQEELEVSMIMMFGFILKEKLL